MGKRLLVVSLAVAVLVTTMGNTLACEPEEGDGGTHSPLRPPGPTPGARPADPPPVNPRRSVDDRQYDVIFEATWTDTPRTVSITYSVGRTEVTVRPTTNFRHVFARKVSYGTPLGIVCVQLTWVPEADHVCRVLIWVVHNRRPRLLGFANTPDRRPAATVADWKRLRI